MKSAEVYRVLRTRMAPYCKENGYRRTDGGMLGWYRSADEMHLTFWCQCSQDGWDGYAGSKFTVEFQWSDDPRPGTGTWRQRIGRLISDEEREDVRTIQNRVIATLPKPPRDHMFLTDPRLRSYYEAKFVQIVEPYAANEDIWFRYHAKDDVGRWADFVADRLPTLLRVFEATARERQRSNSSE